VRILTVHDYLTSRDSPLLILKFATLSDRSVTLLRKLGRSRGMTPAVRSAGVGLLLGFSSSSSTIRSVDSLLC
jgi:hypothetical protein